MQEATVEGLDHAGFGRHSRLDRLVERVGGAAVTSGEEQGPGVQGLHHGGDDLGGRAVVEGERCPGLRQVGT